MTLIDKDEAALAVANVQFGYYDDASGDWLPLSGPAIISAACKAIHAVPARGVGPEDVPFLLRFADGEPHGTGTHDMTAPEDRLYLAGYLETVNHRGRRLTDKGRALVAALAPTDAAHVNETPKSEHDGADVLTVAQAREAALREAADSLLEASVWCDSQERTSPEWHNGVADARKHHIARILALSTEADNDRQA